MRSGGRASSTARRSSACASALVGRHDFTAFTPTETDHTRFHCDVLSAEWRMERELLEFWIEAHTFLRHMNRVLVGTMLEVAAGRREPGGLHRLLSGGERARRGRPRPRMGSPSHASRTAPVSPSTRLIFTPGDRSGPYAGCRTMLNVLLTNDDGIEAEGLQEMRRALERARGRPPRRGRPRRQPLGDGPLDHHAQASVGRGGALLRRHGRLRDRRYAGRLRAAREPRAGRGLRGRPGGGGDQPRREPRR